MKAFLFQRPMKDQEIENSEKIHCPKFTLTRRKPVNDPGHMLTIKLNPSQAPLK